MERRFSRIDAYGKELKLLRTDGDEAFGFEWRGKDGVLTVRQDEKWVSKEDHPDALPQRSHMYGAHQWDADHVRRGVMLVSAPS